MKEQKFKSARIIATAAMILLGLAVSTIDPATHASKSTVEDRAAQIEAALYSRAEFFGAQAILPFPTADARRRLAEVQKQFPQDSGIAFKLAGLDEKLSDAASAEREFQRYVELEKSSLKALSELANFHHRCARFAEEAATRERMITQAPRAERAAILSELIELARIHRLEKYQRPDFFQQLIASDPGAFEVVKSLITHLVVQKDYAEALGALRQHKASFPEEKNYFLDQEVEALLKLKRGKEAEELYLKSFDPFWSRERSRHFYYEFLNDRDRLRAYGRELREGFRRNTADFDLAVRLFHYLHYDYQFNEAGATWIFTQLEEARARRGVKWKTEELATAARLLIASDEGEPASRFLYTLHQQGGLERGSPLRAKVLYQMFELLVDAGDQRTALTAGDLKFYQDVAKSDPHPGMLGGMLSLVLADAAPAREFEQAEEIAIAHFNRAAAYRIFNAYKQEQPTSPELAQMYLDLARFYIAEEDANAAAALLAEFEKRYGDAPQFPEVALKLADCYIGQKAGEQERATYQQILDYFGKRQKKGQPLVTTFNAAKSDDLTSQAPSSAAYLPPSNLEGLEIRAESDHESRYRAIDLTAKNEDRLNYGLILARYVASLAREKKVAEILALYAHEIKKYPDEQGLYEQRLQWLGQTNLVDEQLRVYQEALKRFPSNYWDDRLARWYLRQERKDEFERFSRELISRMDDGEITRYLLKFANAGSGKQASAFEARLYLGLHTLAHERFPHNLNFVDGLLKYYASHGQWDDWRRLMGEYYFSSKPIRERYLHYLASNNRLREYLDSARDQSRSNNLAYKLFRADASVWLANYEDAVEVYRELNQLYPNTPEFADRYVAFSRSFGEKELRSLNEAATAQRVLADASPSSDVYRTTAGEIYAELGDYKRAGEQWEQLIKLGAGDEETYLNTATIYWDYFQYADALRVIKALRRQKDDQTLYAFQTGAILEAQHHNDQAIAEYVKALDEESADHRGALRRLKTLSSRKGVPDQVRKAFQSELGRTKNREALVLGYVELLTDLDRWPEAAALLKREIGRSRSQDFLETAREYFQGHQDIAGEEATLRRLIVSAKTVRFAISFQLQLAENAAGRGQRDQAGAIISQLVDKYPTNYGVLTESSDFCWRIGKRDQAIALLIRAEGRSRGRFHYIFSRKLAARQIERGQLAAAESVLKKLYDEEPRNFDVFNELTRIYVKTSRPDALRERYRETIRAVKASSQDRKEVNDQVEVLRAKVIEAFTQLKDYQAAIEQHIEIINRDPDDENNVATAIQYAKRYGGADDLVAYYTKTSQQAYKDYRWNLVLGRIYEAKKDWANSIREMRKALVNQPEMISLQSELAEVCVKAQDYNAAIEALTKARELSNDDPQYVKRLAEVFDKAGWRNEAKAMRARLPVEKPKSRTLGEQFAAAAQLKRSEKTKAIETYRRAFDAFSKDYYKHALQAHELNGYVETLREEESLDQILRRLWEVRERIARDAAGSDNLLAGNARSLLNTFNYALPEAVGRIASESATGDELAAVELDARQWVSTTKGKPNADESLIVLLNLAHRSGLSRLTENILIARKDSARAIGSADYRSRFESLVNFYAERGAYRKTIELLESEQAVDRTRDGFNYPIQIAELARLLGDGETELRALRADYQSKVGRSTTLAATQSDLSVERYFELLLETGEQGRVELRQNMRQPNQLRFLMISFLARKGELQLAREAIDSTPLPASWKASRQAELSLLARDLNGANEAHFLSALNRQTIGEMVAAKPDATKQLIGDNWFYQAEAYGRWLNLSEKSGQASKTSSRVFLPAMLENRPKDAGEQHRLGRWYLDQNESESALEHLTLALEMNPGSKAILADLGSASFKLGRPAEARELWNRLIATKSGESKAKRNKPALEDCRLYLKTLSKHGLAAEARARLKPIVIDYLSEDDEQVEAVKPLIRALASSFEKDEAGKAEFLRALCAEASNDTTVAESVIREPLVARKYFGAFYELLIKRTEGIARYENDPDFIELVSAHPAWSRAEIEESLDQEDRQEAAEPKSDRLTWQEDYLNYLIQENRAKEAAQLIAEIELEIKNRFPRAAWLRLARLKLDLRAGQSAEALNGLKHFVGIELSPHIDQVILPKLDRLNHAVEMLRRAGRNSEADELAKAAYERTLALEQLQIPSFIGLARLAFEKNETARGLKLLSLMVQLGEAETRETAAAELASLPWVKARAIDPAAIEAPNPSNQIQAVEALRFAAETAGEFNLLSTAIDYRRKLLKPNPDDQDCRLELARLLAADKKSDEAAGLISSLIADRRVKRVTRWTAVWIAPEIVRERPDLWTVLRRAAEKDLEMKTAIDALAVFDPKQPNDALRVLNESESPHPHLKLLLALLQKESGREGEALNSVNTSLASLNDLSLTLPFSATEDELRWLLIRLYAGQGSPRAALKLASFDERLKGKASPETTEPPIEDNAGKQKAGFKTLPARAAERALQSQVSLLGLLSIQAERIEDFVKATEFERAKLNLLADAVERRASEARIEQLLAKQKERNEKKPLIFAVDERPIAVR